MHMTSMKYARRLAGSASLIVLAMSGTAFAQEVKDAPADTVKEEDVIVTGTRIRGVAAVGSATIPVDTATIRERATSSTNEILRDVPQVTNFGAGNNQVGGPQVQNSSLNNTFANSVNLRGLGTTATLTLVDGHRVAPSGGGGGYTDSDLIPAIALQRVEVVADGSSAIYGSDAVAGVVNLRLREAFTGVEAAIGGTFSDGTHSFKVSGIAGLSNDRGSFLIAAEHFKQSPLLSSDRPDLYNDDLTPFGGAAVSNVSFPGNVTLGGVVYAIPANQNGANFTLGQLGAANAPNRQSIFRGTYALPRQERNTVLAKYDYEITENLKFFGYGVYSRREVQQRLAAISNAGYVVPSTNPFSPCAPGKSQVNTVGAACPANGNVSVIYSWFGELGNSVRDAYETGLDITNGFELQLPSNWKATLAGTFGRTKNFSTANSVNNNAVNALLAAPGATINVTVPGAGTVAVTHPTNIPSLNLFCTASPCNDPASLAYITGTSGNFVQSTRKDVTLGADGPLFDLPAGTVRLAVGGEYIHDESFNDTFSNLATATVASAPIKLPTRKSRSTTSAYAEMFVPVFGGSNATPFIQKLDLSLAVRYDRYSDFGATTNPKIGFNWMPTNTITVHGTYGTSFRAPTVIETNPTAGASIIPERAILGSTLTGASNVVATSNYIALTTIGGNANLKAETATTYSLGFDFKPVRNLLLSVNYYNVNYKNRIETPANSAGFPANLNASPLYDSFFVYNPTYYPTRSTVTQAQFNALLAAKLTSTAPAINSVPAANIGILALIDGTRANSGSLATEGFDLAARYAWGSGDSRWNIGATATYVLNYKYSPVAGSPARDYVNIFSTIGSPLQFRGRGQIGWSGYGISTTAFINYQNAYKFPNGINFPINLLPAGVVAANYGDVKANTTFDLAVSYDTRDAGPIFKDIVFRAFLTNAFDKKPPFVVNGTIRYDPTQASQLGRTLSLQVTKRW